MIKQFEDILAWKKARSLTIKTYQVFKSVKDFGLKNQIERASLSVMNNIAEGFEKQGNKEFRHFLFIAKGSCGEVRSMLYVALELNYISYEEFNQLMRLSFEISKMLSGFIKTL